MQDNPTPLLSGDGDCERCVICGALTSVNKAQPVCERLGYIVGIGQLCSRCYQRAMENGEYETDA